MPELPEVETVRRRLRRVMEGARIVRVELRRKSLRGPLPPDFVRRLEGQQVMAVERRAKYLVVMLSSGDALLMHLGMSGSFRVEAPHRVEMPGRFRYDRSEDARHDHVLFELSSGVRVIFNDPRRFGSMAIVRGADLGSHAAIGALGPEPLDRSFTAQTLAGALRGRTMSLKVALGDQRIIAGLGNIYVSEALHEARLSPKRRAGTLVTRSGQPRLQLVTLVSAIQDVLRKAIARQARYRGDDDPFSVYEREGEPCLHEGCRGTIRRIVQGGRSTDHCAVCQR